MQVQQAQHSFLFDTGRGQVPVRLRRSRTGRLVIHIQDEAVVLETASGSCQPADLDFLHSKRHWVARHFGMQQQWAVHRRRVKLNVTREARLFGRYVPVHFHQGSKLYFRYEQGTLHIWLTPRLQGHPHRCVAAVLQQIAKQYLPARTRELAQHTQLQLNAVRVKAHRSKWGSCSIERNINLNWYLILLRKDIIDYVIIHELMHLHEMNHSPRFWRWVGRYLPEYKQLIADLRQDEWVLGTYT